MHGLRSHKFLWESVIGMWGYWNSGHVAYLDLGGLGGSGTMVVTDYLERVEELRFPTEYDMGHEGETESNTVPGFGAWHQESEV